MSTTVAIGVVHGRDIQPEFRQCLTRLMVRDAMMYPGRIIGEYDQYASGAHVDTGRCQVVSAFLEPPIVPEWLLFVDSDATFPDNILDELLSFADPTDAPIVGALAFGVTPQTDANGKAVINSVGAQKMMLYPTLYRFTASGVTHRMLDYPENAMVSVDATGCHCLLIHRKVLQDPRWETTHPNVWFRSGSVIDHGEGKIGEVSEDIYFCIKVRAMGYPIFVNTAAKTGHVKTFIADEDMFIEQRQRDVKVQSMGTGGQTHLTAQTIVFVRAKNEPARVASFLRLWEKQKEESEVVVCVDDDDTKLDQYPKMDGVVVLSGPPGWSHESLMVMAARKARVKSIANVKLAFSFIPGWSKRWSDSVMKPETVIERYDKRRRRVVLIPSRNGERCKKLVRTLIAQGESDRIIVAWNGEDKAFETWLGDQPNVSTMLCESSDGIHKMWNHAITTPLESESDLVFLNDDLEIGDNFVSRLVTGLASFPKVAATCPNYDGRTMTGNAVVNDICANRYDGTGGLSGFAFALNREWLQATGYKFPEDCKWYYGDNDLVMSIYESGWLALMVDGATCVHDTDMTAWETPEMLEVIQHDQEAFFAKWPNLKLILAEVGGDGAGA